MFAFLQVFFCALLWRVAGNAETAKLLAETLPWIILLMMMVPLARFKPGDVLTALKTWRGKDTEGNKT